jgi:hypothetical protein
MENRPDQAISPDKTPKKAPGEERRGLWFWKSALLEKSVVRAFLRPDPPRPGRPGPR